MPHDVFISYSAKDKTTADAICARLESSGIRCWVAPRDIQPGATWAGAIVDAIGASRALVLVFSSSSNDSKQVMREVSAAAEADIPIVPFRIHVAAPSKELGFFVGPAHWLDASSPPLEAHIDRLRDTLRALLGTAASGGPQRASDGSIPPRPPTIRPPRRALIAAFLALAVGCGAVGAWMALRRGDAPSFASTSGGGASPPPRASDPAPVVGAPWTAPLDLAVAAAAAGDWEEASRRLAEAKARGATTSVVPATLFLGVAAYEADPVLEVSEPSDGATARPGPVHVRGRLRIGRKTDHVEVNGLKVPLEDGAFDAEVEAPADGTLDVVVRVVDRGASRGSTLRRSLTIVVPGATPAPVPTATSWKWIAPEGWTQLPDRNMRVATFQPRDATETEVAVFELSGGAGGLDANVQRWCSQMGHPPLTDAELAGLARRPILGRTAVLVRLDGEWTGAMDGQPARKGATLRGMILERAESVIFVRMAGPSEQVRSEEGHFLAFIDSFRE